MESKIKHPDREKKYLITGAAGFIGFHLCRRLLKEGCYVIGLDNLNAYYDVQLKKNRLKQLEGYSLFEFVQGDIGDKGLLKGIFSESRPDIVVNLAAQAGVRFSLIYPEPYIDSNIAGFLNILEACRHNQVEHLIYASSSSVYGLNTQMPFSVHEPADHPVSLYGATKRANELMAHCYSHLFGLPTTGLRFFTVYGPWGRPDMALFLFTDAILKNRPIHVFNNGKMMRDFTYIDDIVEGIVQLLNKPPREDPQWDTKLADPATSSARYRIYNIGNNQPVELSEFIETIEQCLEKKAIKEFLPIQKGDVSATYADIDDLIQDTGFKPQTSIQTGVSNFIRWYKDYYGVTDCMQGDV
jgi:UDP-glucuronate 4-epimerase